MTILTSESDDALAPVRARLLADARRDAEQALDAARREAAARLERAGRDAAAAVEEARQAGEELAAESVARAVARARREARGVVLAAQEGVRARLRDAVRTAVVCLREDAGYPGLLAALTARARAALGEDAEIHEAPDGGVLAEAGSRRVDLSLPRLAERALDEHAREVARLWS